MNNCLLDFIKIQLLVLGFSLIISPIYAQKPKRPEINLDEFIQKIQPIQQENANYDDLYEALFQLYQNPIDLNQATYEDLASMYMLSEIQIKSLLDYRTKLGDFLSIYELQAVPNFDLETIRQILPFVEIHDKLNTKSLTGIFNRATENYVVFRADQVLEKAKGFENGKYLGSPQRTYFRYRMSHPKDFSLNFIAEKDAGEKNYLDYYTFHLQLKNKGNWQNITLGDYQVQIGQGLIASAGYFIGKGGEPITTTRRSHLGIKPYGSLLEGGFFRGGAATYQIKKVALTGFYGFNKRDATIDEVDGEREEYFSSILSTGLHRSENEILRKNQIQEQNFGFNALYQFKNGQIGVSALHTQFDGTLRRSDRLYNKFEFTGNQNTVLGSNFTYNWQNVNFFGEVARSSSGGIGAVGGMIAALSKQVELAINLRNYDKNFHSFYANAFGEASRTINEKGIYWGLKYTPRKGLIFSAFYDRFKFDWLKYLIDAPSNGFDYLFRVTYQPNKKVLFYTQFHEERKGKNLPNNTDKSDIVVNAIRQSSIANFEYAINRVFKTQSRVQFNRFIYENYSKSNGYALIQDIEGSIKKFQLKGRLAYFSTDDYDSRVYAYENDVLYSVSFPAYYGKGFRTYLVTRYALNRKMDLWLRIARTQIQPNDARDTIGSGNDLLPSNHQTQVKMQVRYQF
jgi:hypothetical protein